MTNIQPASFRSRMNHCHPQVSTSIIKSAFALILFLFGVSSINADTLVVGDSGTSFQDLEDSSTNVQASNTLVLDQVTNVLTASGMPPLPFVFRGETGFSAQDANGPFWLEWAGETGYFNSNTDECVLAVEFEALIDLVGTRQGDVYTTAQGTVMRIGPYPFAIEPIGTGSSGSSIMPPQWSTSGRAKVLTFLTGGTHADDSDETASESYTVDLDYAGSSVDVSYVIPIPRDNLSSSGSMLDSSSGDAICNLGASDTWCVRLHDDAATSRLGSAACECDSTSGSSADDACWVLQVDVLVDDTLQLDDITMYWTDFDGSGTGLNGPMAVTLEVTESTYDDLFTYDGEYLSVTTLDAGASAIWHQLAWDQSSSDGEIRLAFDCGDVINGSDFTYADWGEDNAEFYPFQSDQDNPQFELSSSTATVGDPAAYQNHCFGRYATVAAYLLNPFRPVGGSAPQLDSITLSYARDEDHDTFPASLFPDSNPLDCADDNVFAYPGAAKNDSPTSCMEDADRDGYGNANPASGIVPGTDCDDSTPGTFRITYYADCDGDGFGDPGRSINACSEPVGEAICPGNTEPDFWVDNALDCDDSEETVYEGAPEICDTLDNDCDSLVDDADDSVTGQVQWCVDSDEDGFGSIADTQTACFKPDGYVTDCTDCNDGSSETGGGCEVPSFLDGFEPAQ